MAQLYPKADAVVIVHGAYLHGSVRNTEEAMISAILRSRGLSEEVVQCILRAAGESLKGEVPETLEGKILHDAHLIEGGRTFLTMKSLVVGSVRG